MAAPPDAVGFANSMLNKLLAGAGDPNVGPYPDADFITAAGGKNMHIYQYTSFVIAGLQTEDFTRPVVEFDSEWRMYIAGESGAFKNWNRDYGKLRQLCGVPRPT